MIVCLHIELASGVVPVVDVRGKPYTFKRGMCRVYVRWILNGEEGASQTWVAGLEADDSVTSIWYYDCILLNRVYIVTSQSSAAI